MNIGHLKNEAFVKNYKELGFTTRNQLIDAALELLKKEMDKESRAKWRQAAHTEYTKSKMDYAWEPIDGEDFENS